MPNYRRRNKGFVPQARTGGLPYNVIHKACQDQISTITAVEEQVVQTEACATECTVLSPKKRRRKKDKVNTSSTKE